MQKLLDFLYEHSLDKQVYCVLPAADGELELSWQAAEPQHWEVRRARSAHADQVPRADLIAFLTQRDADLVRLERELGACVAAHIVVADQLLAAARHAFGSEGVETVLRGQQDLVRELRQMLSSLLAPRLTLVR